MTTERFLTDEKLNKDEKDYYDECKEFYHLTRKPLVVVADEVLDDSATLSSVSIKIGIDQDCKKFELKEFLVKFCEKLNLNIKDILVKKIQKGSALLEAELPDKFIGHSGKVLLKAVIAKLTPAVQSEFGIMEAFFMFFDPIKSLFKMQKHRAHIRLNPRYNRIYAPGNDFWQGPNTDRKDRGNKPYYCPVGWQRWSFYVTDDFDTKFRGWCIGYHGTKFEHGLSILLNGLKPADIAVHGKGVYLTPSVNYAAHPRYSEVREIDPSKSEKFFKLGKYIQFVLECRVHPDSFKVKPETLGADETIIDPNISNNIIEWVVDTKNKKIIDFNDPNSIIICTGLLIRITDKHPGLLAQSQWWYESHICEREKCCLLGAQLKILEMQKQRGETCEILFTK